MQPNLINWGQWSSALSAWDVVKQSITDIPRQEYRLWIEPLKPVNINTNTLTVKCPNTFWQDLVEERYLDVLNKAGKKANLEIILIT